MSDNEWLEVKAWQAMKAYQEGMHDVEWQGTNNKWFTEGDEYFHVKYKYRIRFKQIQFRHTAPEIFEKVERHVDVNKTIADPLELLGKWYVEKKTISLIENNGTAHDVIIYGLFYGTLEECKAKYKELNK
jgi:hypothetical protein